MAAAEPREAGVPPNVGPSEEEIQNVLKATRAAMEGSDLEDLAFPCIFFGVSAVIGAIQLVFSIICIVFGKLYEDETCIHKESGK